MKLIMFEGNIIRQGSNITVDTGERNSEVVQNLIENAPASLLACFWNKIETKNLNNKLIDFN